MSFTTDPTDPRLAKGNDEKPLPQAPVYLVLSEEERAKGFVRPVRQAYRHVGHYPKHQTRPLTEEEHELWGHGRYAVFEPYPEGDSLKGRFWTQDELDRKACNAVTTMALPLAETYARNPRFYGGTYCATCQMHRPVNEFVWDPDGSVVGS